MSLSLKLKMSNEKITSVNGMRLHGGSILIADYIKSIGIEESLDTLLPKAGKSRYISPLIDWNKIRHYN